MNFYNYVKSEYSYDVLRDTILNDDNPYMELHSKSKSLNQQVNIYYFIPECVYVALVFPPGLSETSSYMSHPIVCFKLKEKVQN